MLCSGQNKCVWCNQMLYCVFHVDPDFFDLIQYRFCRERRLGVVGDIYDGSAYSKHSELFEFKYNISFALNFDGAPKFKSSATQIWPVQLYINELPPTIRSVMYIIHLNMGLQCMCMYLYSRVLMCDIGSFQLYLLFL